MERISALPCRHHPASRDVAHHHVDVEDQIGDLLDGPGQGKCSTDILGELQIAAAAGLQVLGLGSLPDRGDIDRLKVAIGGKEGIDPRFQGGKPPLLVRVLPAHLAIEAGIDQLETENRNPGRGEGLARATCGKGRGNEKQSKPVSHSPDPNSGRENIAGESR